MVAQLVRAPPCHGGGRGFKSHSLRIKRKPGTKSAFSFCAVNSKSLNNFYVGFERKSGLQNSASKGFLPDFYLQDFVAFSLGES